MKKALLGWLIGVCALLSALSALALTADCPVPAEELHEAVLALGARSCGEGGDGKYLCEGHVVLGCEEAAQSVDVYMSIRYQRYGFMAGIFTGNGPGCGTKPVKMTFQKPNFDLISVQLPDDGMNYGTSIARMLPDTIEDAWHGDAIDAQLVAQMDDQARAYVHSLGRTEAVMDWRALDPPLVIAEALTSASNMLTRFSPYPLWVTAQEAVEDGVRYRYEHIWEPDGLYDGVTYALPGGGQRIDSGDTGTEIFRKTRISDAEIVEEITARIELQRLTVTVWQPEGARTYTLRMTGEGYARESIVDTGTFVLGDGYLSQFDVDVMRLDAWAEGTPELGVTVDAKET